MLNHFLNDLRSTPRLRLLMALVVCVLGLYALLFVREALQNAEQQHQSVALNITRLRAQLTQTEWLERLPPAKTLAVQMEARLWQAPTAGLAQAALQDWLNAILLQAKASKPQITVTVVDEMVGAGGSARGAAPVAPAPVGADGSAATPPDLWKIKAKVGFAFNAPTLLEVLNRIENHDRQLIVSAMTVRKEPYSQVEMDLVAYFQKQAAADKTGTPPAAVPTVRP